MELDAKLWRGDLHAVVERCWPDQRHPPPVHRRRRRPHRRAHDDLVHPDRMERASDRARLERQGADGPQLGRARGDARLWNGHRRLRRRHRLAQRLRLPIHRRDQRRLEHVDVGVSAATDASPVCPSRRRRVGSSTRLASSSTCRSDEPRFKYRGLMVDCARHFMPLRFLERVVETMARAKLNVLHRM